jgi:iron complex outermembrane receptor protein
MKDGSARREHALLVVLLTTAGLATVARADDSEPAGEKVTILGNRSPLYRTEDVQVGPLLDRALIDTPYSIDVVPFNLSINQQLKSLRDVFRYLPSVQGENIRPQTRGLQAGVVQNTHIDGLNIAATTDYPVEEFDRVEVLNGLAGAVFGPANPAGTFNFVLKRPTLTPYRSVSVSYATQESKLASLDVGDTLGDNKVFGYRVNLVSDRGEGYVDHSRLERTLLSLALDFRPTESTKLELDANRYHYVDMGFPGTFALANNVRFPDSPDPKTVGYGQPYGGDDNVTRTFSGRLKYDFNSDWHIAAGILQQDSDRASTVPTNTLTSNAGAYRTTAATTTFSLDRIVSNSLALNGHVETGPLSHDLLVSNTGFNWSRYTPYQIGAITLGNASLASPVIFAEPVFPDFDSRFKSLITQQQSVMVGDTVGLGDGWSAGLIGSQSWIKSHSLDKNGKASNRYDEDGVSVNATLTYKPASNMTVYGSYADNLQQGDIAPTGSANAGAELAPYRAKQEEVGYKVALDRMNLTADVFRIRRPYALVGADNVFTSAGEQANDGFEVTANGTLMDYLAIFSGITYLNPRVSHTGVAATDGKQVLGLSKVVGSVLLDYRFPAIPDLAVNVHVAHATSRPGDNANTYRVDGFTTTDLGVRYVSHLWGTLASWNLAIDNIAGERYWANITPTGQNGYIGAGNGQGTLGAPRMVHAALQVEF